MKCTGSSKHLRTSSWWLAGLTAPVSQDLDGHIALCEAKMVRDGVVNIIVISTSYTLNILQTQTNHKRADSGGAMRICINIDIVFTRL